MPRKCNVVGSFRSSYSEYVGRHSFLRYYIMISTPGTGSGRQLGTGGDDEFPPPSNITFRAFIYCGGFYANGMPPNGKGLPVECTKPLLIYCCYLQSTRLAWYKGKPSQRMQQIYHLSWSCCRTRSFGGGRGRSQSSEANVPTPGLPTPV